MNENESLKNFNFQWIKRLQHKVMHACNTEQQLNMLKVKHTKQRLSVMQKALR